MYDAIAQRTCGCGCAVRCRLRVLVVYTQPGSSSVVRCVQPRDRFTERLAHKAAPPAHQPLIHFTVSERCGAFSHADLAPSNVATSYAQKSTAWKRSRHDADVDLGSRVRLTTAAEARLSPKNLRQFGHTRSRTPGHKETCTMLSGTLGRTKFEQSGKVCHVKLSEM
jgi:hypothetical protein